MKNYNVLFLFIVFFFSSSCQETKVVCCALPPDQLSGKWHLINVLHGFSSFQQEYPRDTIVWDFNTQNHSVTIQNNSSNTADRYIFENGTYSYTLTPNTDGNLDCLQTLVVQDINLGCCTITNGELSLSSIAMDGDFIKLVR